MKVKRKTEITLETRRRLIVCLPESEAAEQMFCPLCERDAPLVQAEHAAEIFNVSRREVYRMVEAGRLHFVESADGVLYVCLRSFESERTICS